MRDGNAVTVENVNVLTRTKKMTKADVYQNLARVMVKEHSLFM